MDGCWPLCFALLCSVYLHDATMVMSAVKLIPKDLEINKTVKKIAKEVNALRVYVQLGLLVIRIEIAVWLVCHSQRNSSLARLESSEKLCLT